MIKDYINRESFIKIVLFLGVLLFSIYFCFSTISLEETNADNYDEKMWAGASIASYNMFFRGYQREKVNLERWFLSFANKYSYDVRRMPYKQAQWFDDAMWTFGWKAPNIAKFIMGYFIVNFGNDVDSEGYFHRFNKDKAINKWPGNYLPLDFVYLARIPNAIMTILSILLIFCIGWKYFNYYVGLFAASYLLFNPTYILVNSQARVSGTATLFSCIVLFSSLYLIKKLLFAKKINLLIIFSFLIGISFAFAVGAKLNAGLILYVFIAYFIAFVLLSIKKNKAEVNSLAKKRKKIFKK